MTEQRIFLPEENHFSSYTPEATAVQEVFGLDPLELGDTDLQEFNALVAITAQFSRIDLQTGERQIISPSRIAAIPAITARHCRLVEPARGQLNPEQVKEQWEQRMPENDGLRHPDLLFDMTQFNFGTDDPIDDIVRGLTQAERRRQELVAEYKSMIRARLAHSRYEQPLDEDGIEDIADEMINQLR